MSSSNVTTDKIQATFIPARKGNPGKMFFWLPPQCEESILTKYLANLSGSFPALPFEDMRVSLVLPASWVLKRKPRANTPRIVPVQGKALSVLDTLSALSSIDEGRFSRRRLTSSLTMWSLATKFALELIIRGQMLPYIAPRSTDSFKALWKASLWLRQDEERFLKLANAMPLSAYAVASRKKDSNGYQTLFTSKSILQHFLDEIADTLVRYAGDIFAEELGEEKEQRQPFNSSDSSWQSRLIESLTAVNPSFHLQGFTERGIPETLNKWLHPGMVAQREEDYRICFRLEMPSGSEKNDNQWQVSYLLQAVDDPSLLVSAERIWKSSKRELYFLNRTFKDPQEKLLMALAEASCIFPPLAESLQEACPSCMHMKTNEAWNFLDTAAPILQQSGFTVLLPQELTRAGQRRIKARMRIGSRKSTDKSGSQSGTFALPSLIDYHWEIALGDEVLTLSEFKQIARLKQPLVHWRDRWVIINPQEAADMKKLFDEVSSGTLSFREALSATLLGEKDQIELASPVEVVATGNMKHIVDMLKTDKTARCVEVPSTFQGKLRAYQERGLTWLTSMTNLGFGVCLADDMGLGKTIQLIAWLLHRKEHMCANAHPVLIVCPTSVLGNWQREIERFGPELSVLPHHGLERATSKKSMEKSFSPHVVVLTTYSLARRDRELLSEIEWGAVVLDEAQNIKNPYAQQARAIRQFKAHTKIALTGTPVENRLSELWSIFEFLNSHYLGPLKQFKRTFALPIERYKDPEATQKFKKLTQPFLLRRLKTDKTIIADLPEKNEMKVFCTLTREQATLYQALLDETMEKIEKSEGMARRGLVLSLITSLKQICNHPSLYLREGASSFSRSGKLKRLVEMSEEVMEEKSYALIFTQFREMGHLLARCLEDKFGETVPFLHGGVLRAKRDEMVRSFQEKEDAYPLFLISLRAGGTGLNLTRASFVFHFDRWWNPAVENQATDRAFRIGQKKNVQVYKMVCLGTMEERIDRMLEEKRDLADRIIGAGEGWITELSNDKLREILTLSKEAAIDLEDE